MFAFAADPRRPSPEGTAPLAVQARQLPRLMVARLNSGCGNRLRFFPFMGLVRGERRFFDITQAFDPEQLRQVHGQPEVGLIVEGELSTDRIVMRIHEARAGGRVLDEIEAPFDPARPWGAMKRLMFELTGRIDWHGPVPDLPPWSGPALGWYLIARDELLAIEAEMPCADVGRRLRAARTAFALAPDEREIAITLLDTCRALLTRGVDGEVIAAELATALAEHAPHDGDVLADAAGLIEHGRGAEAATPFWAEAARRSPLHPLAAIRAGYALYQQGRTAEGLELLRAAHAAGNRATELRAQLAAAEEECGDPARRDALLFELAGEPMLPVSVARLVASFLVDRERPRDAVTLVDRVRQGGVEHAGLWLERGRALLTLGDLGDARFSLERCLACDPGAEIRMEARRLLRLAADEKLLPTIEALEKALREDLVPQAAALARALVRQHHGLAEAWLLLGIVRQRAGQARRALRAFARAVQLEPELGEAQNRLGVLLVARGRELEGYKHLRQATELMPHDASPWLHLAQACLRLGFRGEAEAAFARAERIGGHETEVEQIRSLFGKSA